MKELKFEDVLKEQLKDEEFKKEWDDSQQEFNIIRTMIKARVDQNISQAELARRTGIDQSNISKIERGIYNPSLSLLKRLADGMGMDLNISFTPKSSVKFK